MSQGLLRLILWATLACIAVATLASCASAPKSDGGIVGTGNRPDCETRMKPDGTPASVPEECKQPGAAR